MMLKNNFLIGILGILVGFIGGFAFANGVNRSAATAQDRSASSIAAKNVSANPATSSIEHGPGDGHDHGSAPGTQPAQGEMPADIRQALDLAKNEPDNFDAQMEAAQMYYTIKRYEPALGYLQRAHEIRPDAYDVIVRLGNANYYLERYDEAAKQYEQALALRPDDVGVRSDLGLMFYLRGDLDRAIKEFNRNLEQDSRHEQTLQNLTVALRDKKRDAEARSTLARLEAAHPQNETIARLRESLARQ